MDLKKWVPWNWFKKEEENIGKMVPVRRHRRRKGRYDAGDPVDQLHRDIDGLFEDMYRGFGLAPWVSDMPLMPRLNEGILKPTLDLGASDDAYTVSVEVPGVDEKDVHLEIADDTLTIRGEKKQEKEDKAKDFYRMERSYGAFQRVLSLPEDVDQDGIQAKFKKGVLTVTLPRKALPESQVKKIEVQSG